MKTIASNKRTHFDYHVETTYDAGIVLDGWEAKSIRDGRINFNESYAKVINGEIFLIGCTVTPALTTLSSKDVDTTRSKKLLLNKKEISTIIGKISVSGYTLVPISVFLNDRRMIKVQIGLAKGKKQFDKREDAKQKDVKRDIDRVMKNNRD